MNGLYFYDTSSLTLLSRFSWIKVFPYFKGLSKEVISFIKTNINFVKTGVDLLRETGYKSGPIKDNIFPRPASYPVLFEVSSKFNLYSIFRSR